MEMTVWLGRRSVLAYQNEAGRKLGPLPLGAAMPSLNNWVITPDEVNEEIWAGRALSFVDRPLVWRDSPILVTRDYSPLYGPGREIIGVISVGITRAAPLNGEIAELASIVSALECLELPSELCAEAQFQGSSRRGLSGSVELAQRLKRFLPQPAG